MVNMGAVCFNCHWQFDNLISGVCDDCHREFFDGMSKSKLISNHILVKLLSNILCKNGDMSSGCRMLTGIIRQTTSQSMIGHMRII